MTRSKEKVREPLFAIFETAFVHLNKSFQLMAPRMLLQDQSAVGSNSRSDAPCRA
jgi:hypothetical protein